MRISFPAPGRELRCRDLELIDISVLLVYLVPACFVDLVFGLRCGAVAMDRSLFATTRHGTKDKDSGGVATNVALWIVRMLIILVFVSQPMIPTYVFGWPTGEETGDFLAVDLGTQLPFFA